MRRFLKDQRTVRRMKIPRIGLFVQNSQSKTVVTPFENDIAQVEIDIAQSESAIVESDIIVPDQITLRNGRTLVPRAEGNKRNYVKLTKTAKVADRYHIPNTIVAAVASAVLEDHKVIDATNKQHVIDPNKVARNREIVRKCAIENQERNRAPVIGLYFDSRCDDTKVRVGNKTIIQKEDHMSMVSHPGSFYLGHVTTPKKCAPSASQDMWSYIEKHSIDTEDLDALGGDGTAVNIGWRGGINVYLERKAGRALQWLICLLHFNELPLKNLLKKHDGKTKSPTLYSGPLGSQLDGCEKLPIVKFQPIEFKCAIEYTDVAAMLSSDQRYLYDICSAISEGVCSPKLATRSPGNLSHARFHTLANRLCRLYVSTRKPCALLKLMTKYVLWVYAPAHFKIKAESSCLHGAVHFANIVTASSFLPEEYLVTVQNTFRTNAFFAHPENVILAILNDRRFEIRVRGWQKILEISQSQKPTKEIRPFKLDFEINFMAENYSEIIDWENEFKTVPPILRKFKFESKEAADYAAKKLCDHNFGIDLEKIPCHTQSVERCVKLVTEASLAVIGEEKREGFILNTLQSRNEMPIFRTKRDFNCNDELLPQVRV